MDWTKENPTAPGWYWYWAVDMSAPRCVEVLWQDKEGGSLVVWATAANLHRADYAG